MKLTVIFSADVREKSQTTSFYLIAQEADGPNNKYEIAKYSQQLFELKTY
jgi:hypothetical protein